MKGVLYVMTTVVPGLVKIGKTNTSNFEERMYKLESDGYKNITGLKRLFAIEVEDYDQKEKMLHTIFSKSNIEGTELFAVDKNLVVQFLSSFEGRIIYPPEKSREDIFNEASREECTYQRLVREGFIEEKISNLDYPKKKPFRFSIVDIGIGEELAYIDDPSIVVTVVSDNEVSYNGEIYSLSTLAEKLKGLKAVQGSLYFTYKGERLTDLCRRKEYEKG